jgi:hypothetical protein
MKKKKFEKLVLSGVGQQVMFNDGQGRVRLGRMLGPASPGSITVHDGKREISVERKNVLGRTKSSRWVSADLVPPEDKLLLAENKITGDIKMGRLLDKEQLAFYGLNKAHLHDGHWHKPMPLASFSYWSLVQERKK